MRRPVVGVLLGGIRLAAWRVGASLIGFGQFPLIRLQRQRLLGILGIGLERFQRLGQLRIIRHRIFRIEWIRFIFLKRIGIQRVVR